jgi:hypothetical protein
MPFLPRRPKAGYGRFFAHDPLFEDQSQAW